MGQIFLGESTWTTFVDRVVARACAASRGLDEADCRELVELVVLSRLRATDACGRHPACQPDGSRHANGPCAGWDDPDTEALPRMLAASLTDRIGPTPQARAALEDRLAHELRGELDRVLFENPRCGHAEVCGGEPVFPLRRR